MSGVIDLAIVKSPFASTRVFLTLEDLFWLGHDWQRILITDETDEQMIYLLLVNAFDWWNCGVGVLTRPPKQGTHPTRLTA
jgi:hypothetical protein